jgi:hypothetical protein
VVHRAAVSIGYMTAVFRNRFIQCYAKVAKREGGMHLILPSKVFCYPEYVIYAKPIVHLIMIGSHSLDVTSVLSPMNSLHLCHPMTLGD